MFAKSQNEATLVLGDSTPSVLMLTVTHHEKSKSKSKSKQYTRWVLINVFEFLCLCFFSLSTRKRGIQLVFVFGFWSKNCCWCLQKFNFINEGFSLFGTGLASSKSLLRFIFHTSKFLSLSISPLSLLSLCFCTPL